MVYVLLCLFMSFCFSGCTAESAAHVGLHDAPVDKGCEAVHQQHCEHGAFGVAVVIGADDDCHHAYKEAVDVLAGVGAGGGYGVGGHEYGGEGEAPEQKLVDGGKVRRRVDGRCEGVGDPAHEEAAGEYRHHHAPRCHACGKQEDAAKEDAERRGLAEGAWDKAEESLPTVDDAAVDAGELYVGACLGGELSQWRGAAEAVGQGGAVAEGDAGGYIYLVARHLRGVGEEEEGACHKGDVEDVVARASEHLLGEDDGEGHGHGEHPQRYLRRAYQWHKETGDEESFLYLFMFYLREGELYAKADNVGHGHARKDGEEAVEHKIPEGKLCGA